MITLDIVLDFDQEPRTGFPYQLNASEVPEPKQVIEHDGELYRVAFRVFGIAQDYVRVVVKPEVED